MENKGDFTELMEKHANVSADAEDEPEAEPETASAAADPAAAAAAATKDGGKKDDAKDGKIVTVEARDKGRVKTAVYSFYARQVSYGLQPRSL